MLGFLCKAGAGPVSGLRLLLVSRGRRVRVLTCCSVSAPPDWGQIRRTLSIVTPVSPVQAQHTQSPWLLQSVIEAAELQTKPGSCYWSDTLGGA